MNLENEEQVSNSSETTTSEEVPVPLEDRSSQSLRIVVSTFNILGSRDTEFIDAVANEMATLEVDVVAVQGCHKFNNESLFRAFKQRGYNYTRFDQLHTRPVSEIMFYGPKVLVRKKEYTPFSSSAQNKGIAKYKVVLSKNPLAPEVWVITSQLEENGSGNGYRKAQINEIATQFGSSAIPIIFAGDTCIPSWQDLQCPSGWFDAWREKGTSDNDRTSSLDRMDQIWYRPARENITSPITSRTIECLSYDLVVCGDSTRKGVVSTFESLITSV